MYVDDILVLNKTFEEHLWLLEEVSNILRVANQARVFQQKKQLQNTYVTSFRNTAFTCFSHVDPEKYKAVSKFPVPNTEKQIKSF